VYELFEHTADLGLRVVAPDPSTLFREAAEGFFSVIIEKVPRCETPERLEFRLEADSLEFLLVDWLSELLYTFDTRHLLLDSFVVDVRGTTLTATALSRPFDEAHDPLLHEVKAVTYHALRVAQTPTGWLAEVILDI
jgi:SHS2 domain-containing protein